MSRVLRSRKDRPIQNAARKRDIEKCGKLGGEAGIGVFWMSVEGPKIPSMLRHGSMDKVEFLYGREG